MNEERILKAMKFALEKHNRSKEPYRKGTEIPYIVHPFSVMNILLEEGVDDDVIIAGILHDTVEDTDTNLDEIEQEFGKKIRDIVDTESEPEELKKDPDKRGTWKLRKEHTIEGLKKADFESKMATCADKLDNIRSIRNDLVIMGDELWNKFNASKEDEEWYYRSILDALKELSDRRCYMLLKEEVERVFG